MKLSLRAGEKIYMNGAVFSVDRRVSLHLLNDATFLLEAHVMQAGDATTPLRQVYFAIQLMLMDPDAATKIEPSVRRMLDDLYELEKEPQARSALQGIGALLRTGRAFEALRAVRELYRQDDARLAINGQEKMEAASPCS